jgi:hypothetical protein
LQGGGFSFIRGNKPIMAHRPSRTQISSLPLQDPCQPKHKATGENKSLMASKSSQLGLVNDLLVNYGRNFIMSWLLANSLEIPGEGNEQLEWRRI